MSQQEPHQGQETGHELDVMPNRRLFNLLTSLTALTLLACIGLVGFFYDQANALFLERAKEGSFLVREYQEEVREVAEGYGPTGDGRHFFVPHEKAKELVLADPGRFKAAPPPPGWIHPDDLQGGGVRTVPPTAPADGRSPSESSADEEAQGGAGQAAVGEGEAKEEDASAGGAQPAAGEGPPSGGGAQQPSGVARGGDGAPADEGVHGAQHAPRTAQGAAAGTNSGPGRASRGSGRRSRTESNGAKADSNARDPARD